MHKTGCDDWWRTISGPQIEAVDDAYRVTFWWRDPAGDEASSATRRVWIYITGVTDHHKNAVPQTLQRIPGTDAALANHAFSHGAAATALSLPRATTTFLLSFLTATARTARCCAKAGAGCCSGRLPTRSIRKAGRAGAVTRSPRWSCRKPRSSRAGRCVKNLISLRSALSGAASGSATADEYGFTPPATRSRSSARWRSCSTASSGPKVCRYGRRWQA